jgi:TolA-binding protein
MSHNRMQASEIPALVAFVQTHRQWFIGAGTVALIAAVMLALVANRRAEGELRVWEKLYGVMAIMSRDTAESERLLSEVRQSARSGASAGVVRYLTASLAYQKGEYPAAVTYARDFIRGGRPAAFVPVGYLLLGQAARASGDLPTAIKAFGDFIGKYRGHALEPMALEMLMQSHLEAGDQAKAREVAEQITISNPNTEWAKRAELVLSTAGQAGAMPSAH